MFLLFIAVITFYNLTLNKTVSFSFIQYHFITINTGRNSTQNLLLNSRGVDVGERYYGKEHISPYLLCNC